jgi:uncharacterized protein
MTNATVADNAEQRRFELRDGDAVLGRLDYRPGGDSLILAHTEVDAARTGEGLGGLLVRGALEQLRAQGRTVIPLCPFAAAWLRRHPEFRDVIDPSFRS